MINPSAPKRKKHSRKGESSMHTDDYMRLLDLIDWYVSLQRIITSDNPQKEIVYQIRTTKEKLKVFGFDAEDLDIK